MNRKSCQIKFSPIIKHDVIRNTHARIFARNVNMHGTSKPLEDGLSRNADSE